MDVTIWSVTISGFVCIFEKNIQIGNNPDLKKKKHENVRYNLLKCFEYKPRAYVYNMYKYNTDKPRYSNTPYSNIYIYRNTNLFPVAI